MTVAFLTRTLAAGLLLAGAAHAAPAPAYDDFSSINLDPARWTEGEMWRYVDPTGRLVMGRNSIGGSTSDTGVVYENMNLTATTSAPARILKATIRVVSVSVPSVCVSNLTQPYAYSRARVIGALFNARPGGAVSGDRTGDVLMQIRVGRTSNTGDAEGVLRVQGVLSMCSSADCNASTLIAPVQDLGTTTVGGSVKVGMVWSKANNTVTFTRDALTPVTVTYTESDKVGPMQPFNNVSVRNDVPNCLMGGPAVRAGMSAMFDSVYITPN